MTKETIDSIAGPRPGVLFLVATPIGNLGDLSPRARDLLRDAALLLAEDTRHTSHLLHACGITRPAGALESFHEHNERERVPRVLERLRAGASVALVSDAGTPGIADPGYHLVRGAIAAGIRVEPVPGPSAVAALVSVAGLAVDRFTFEGFQPARAAARGARLRALAAEERAMVFLEAGRRLEGFLADAEAALGDREAVIGRELTKLHEEILRGRLSELRARIAGVTVRGEVTVIVAGVAEGELAGEGPTDAVDDAIVSALATGESVRQIADELSARLGRPRRAVYQRALALRDERRGG